LLGVAALTVCALWLVGRAFGFGPAQAPVLALNLGPYHIEVPMAFSPEAGMPGDPRRSKYVFMIVPLSRLGLPPSRWLAAHPNTGMVPSLHLDPGDAARLKRYNHIPLTSSADRYRGYTGRQLADGAYLYVASDAGEPLYLTCPMRASQVKSPPSMLCNVEETLVKGRNAMPDLTVEYAFPWDFWPELSQLSNAIKAFTKTLVSDNQN
jgi:hypothetical protein